MNFSTELIHIFFVLTILGQFYWSNFTHELGIQADLEELAAIIPELRHDDILLRYNHETGKLDGDSNRHHSFCEIALGMLIHSMLRGL